MSSSVSVINIIAPIVGVVIGSLLTGFNNKKHTKGVKRGQATLMTVFFDGTLNP